MRGEPGRVLKGVLTHHQIGSVVSEWGGTYQRRGSVVSEWGGTHQRRGEPGRAPNRGIPATELHWQREIVSGTRDTVSGSSARGSNEESL